MSISRPHPFDGATGLLASIGRTPLVRLREVVRGVVPEPVEVWVKLESRNPGGSVKDRAALSMVLDAERKGRLRPGATLLDASSGNTGIALALVAAARGYRLRICLPSNANAERKQLLRAYGADIVLTSPLEGTDGAIRKARELAEADSELIYLDQYSNPANWQAHYGSTGPEIVAQSGRRLTHFVAIVGTSGTFVGTTKYLRDLDPKIQCCEVQPEGPFHGLEGAKHMPSALVPPIYEPTLADQHLTANSEASFAMCRELAKQEGLLVGPSSGAAVVAALNLASGLQSGVVVTLAPDGGERYLSEPHIFGVST